MLKRQLHIIVVISLIFTGLTSCSWQLKSNSKPNVIIILSDDQGWGDVGYNGNKIIQTPVLDSISTLGVVFDRFYVSPNCASTRASILTGNYHMATDTLGLTHCMEVIPDSEITIAQALKANGYATAYFGKWHNPHVYPLDKGFDSFFGFSMGDLHTYFDTELDYNNTKVSTRGYITNVLTDSVLSYITHTKKPFLAFVALSTPHTPYQVPDKYFNKYIKLGLDAKTAAIYGMCENIDENVLRIQSTLKKAKKHDNTIFIFMSDNGPNYVRYNGGLKGRKAQVDEGGVRVPFIFDFPAGKIVPRKVTNDFAAHIDVFPTLLDLCSISADTIKFDGISFARILMDTSNHLSDRKFYSYQKFDENNVAGSVRTNSYLLTCYSNDTALYNLNKDPCQMVNISGYEPLVYKLLKNDFDTWSKQKNIGIVKTLATK